MGLDSYAEVYSYMRNVADVGQVSRRRYMRHDHTSSLVPKGPKDWDTAKNIEWRRGSKQFYL